MIQRISAVTLAVRDMARSIEFYEKLGFVVIYGGKDSVFTTVQSGDAFVNLAASPSYRDQCWGRVIFRVDDADAHYRRILAAEITAEIPSDGSWGERFFHLRDPDGHEISFAELLRATEPPAG